jgi:hypothetical protein
MSSYKIEAVEGGHHRNPFPHIANLAHFHLHSFSILNPLSLSLFRRIANVGVGTSLFEGRLAAAFGAI